MASTPLNTEVAVLYNLNPNIAHTLLDKTMILFHYIIKVSNLPLGIWLSLLQSSYQSHMDTDGLKDVCLVSFTFNTTILSIRLIALCNEMFFP